MILQFLVACQPTYTPIQVIAGEKNGMGMCKRTGLAFALLKDL